MMTQTKTNKLKRRLLDGILLLDKPKDITSNQILQKIRRIYLAEKAGHSGTLDPMATGMLPICFGEATKFTSQLLDQDKTYEFTCLLGQKTSTGDREGDIIQTCDIPSLNTTIIENIFNKFIGKIEQIPPMVSALHHNGQRLYELARQGIEVERKPRLINIVNLTLTSFNSDSFSAQVTCSKGTYVRVLAEDIANALGSVGHLTYLRRLSIKPFTNHLLITLEQIDNIKEDITLLDNLLLPIDSALIDLPKYVFPQEESKRLLQGQRIRVEEELTENLYRLYSDNSQFLGIGIPNTPYSIGAKRIIRNKND